VLSANLQLRIFPSIVMIASPLVSAWLVRLQSTVNLNHKSVWISTSMIIGCLMILSLLKSTNEPLISNYWPFVTPAERASVDWAKQALQDHTLWTGQWSRIVDSNTIRENGAPKDINLVAYLPQSTTHDYLISDAIQLFSQRIGGQLPVETDDFITYDNGSAQIYHRRPVTPFQK
jgi:hypothetical protein